MTTEHWHVGCRKSSGKFVPDPRSVYPTAEAAFAARNRAQQDADSAGRRDSYAVGSCTLDCAR